MLTNNVETIRLGVGDGGGRFSAMETTSERQGTGKTGCILHQQMEHMKPLAGGLSGLLAEV